MAAGPASAAVCVAAAARKGAWRGLGFGVARMLGVVGGGGAHVIPPRARYAAARTTAGLSRSPTAGASPG